MTGEPRATNTEDIFAGVGQMGDLMRSLDWSPTPLGGVETWPQSLKSAVGIILGSRYPLFIWWGREMINLYNDACIRLLGRRHPEALGKSAREVWAEVWSVVGPQAEDVLNEGKPSWNEELPIVMERDGYGEETYFTFSLSPIKNDGGGVGGIFCACTEDTRRVIDERRLRTLRELGAETAKVNTAREACEISARIFERNPQDIPFALIYLTEGDGERVRLAAATPDLPEGAKTESSWPLKAVLASGESCTLDNLAARFGKLPGGTESRPPNSAIALPLTRSGEETLGVLVLGIGPLRPFDGDYRGFFELVAGQVTAALSVRAKSSLMLAQLRREAADRERALRQETETMRQQIRAILENLNAPAMTWMTDPAGCCIYLSQSWYEFTGQTEKAALGLGWTDAVHSDDREQAKRTFLAANDRREAFRLEYRLRDKDGQYRHCIDAASPWFGEDGEFKGYVGSVIDIGDRKAEELALREAHIQLGAALAAGSVYTWRWNLAENLVTTDANFAHLFGIDPEDAAAGLPVEQYLNAIHPEDRPGVTAAIDRAIATGEDCAAEYRTRNADGEERWVIARGRVEYDGSGNAITFPGAVADITDRKRAEDAIRKNAARLEFILAASNFGTWEVDLRSQPYAAHPRSPQHDRIYGYDSPPPEWTYETFIGHVHPDDRPRVEESFLETVTTYSNWDVECRIIRADGARRWVWIGGSVYRNSRGEPVRLMGLIADISDRKQTEETLRRSEERYRTLFESIDEGFCVVEILFDEGAKPVDYRFLEINPSFERQTGLKDAPGKTARELVPNLEEYWFEIYGEVALTGQSRRFEHSSPAMNSWFDVYAFHVGEPESRKVAILFNEISDRKRTELALRRSEDRLRMAMESAQLGTWDWNFSTDELSWDANCKAMFGLPPDAEISLEVFFQGLHPDDRDRVERVIEESLNSAGSGNYDTEYRTVGIGDGVERWIAAKGQTYFDGAGNPLRFIGTVLDITERKLAERERERLLEREQAARAEAERANRIKDEFLAVLSHELRTPLNPILGWTRLLQTRKFDETQTAEALAVIERNVRLQTQLIDDLLDVARILRGKLSLNTAPVCLSDVVAAAIDTVETAAKAKFISLNRVLPDIGEVWGDSTRLQQVVWNLLSNAIKFTPNGGRVEIRLERVGGEAEITVADTGKGIGPDFLPHIFDSFKQEDSSITRSHGGLGLGLAIVRQLVEAHGGGISAESPGVGRGATFTVRLPLLNREPRAETVRDSLPTELDLTAIRVLAVDDDLDTREFIKVLLTQFGATVLAVGSGKEVLAALESFEPDILVSDIGMPEMDGLALLCQIRCLPPEKGGQVPAIALTAYAGEEDRRRVLSSGYQEHVPKPLDLDQLVKAVYTVTSLTVNSEQ